MRLILIALSCMILHCGMTLVYGEPSTTELSECETLLIEAESVLTDLLTENDVLRTELETSWSECERIARDLGETVADEAEAAHLVIVEALRVQHRREVWKVGAIAGGVALVVGFVIGVIL